MELGDSTLLEEVNHVKAYFNQIFACHIYRERKIEADLLSKEGARQDMGHWVVVAVEGGQIQGIEQPPFAR